MTIYQVFLLYVQKKGGSSFEKKNYFCYMTNTATPEQRNHTRSRVINPFLVHHYNKLSLPDLCPGAENMILL